MCDSGSNCHQGWDIRGLGSFVLTLGGKAAVRGQDSGCASGRTCLLGCLGAALLFERQPPWFGCLCPPAWACSGVSLGNAFYFSVLRPGCTIVSTMQAAGFITHSLLRIGTCLGSPFAQASHMGRGAQTSTSWGVSLHRHIGVSRSRLLRTHLGVER